MRSSTIFTLLSSVAAVAGQSWSNYGWSNIASASPTTGMVTMTTTKPTSSPTASTTIEYSVVLNYFAQSQNSTNATTFDYALYNFGLINQTYDTDSSADAGQTQWQRFAIKLASLQKNAAPNVDYKVLFMGRHGEGLHNTMESYVGTPAWNCYWSLLDGANSSFVYFDAALTSNGIAQTKKANNYWLSRIQLEKIPTIQSYYSSPLTRCLQTCQYSYSNLPFPELAEYPFSPLIKELLREGISEHTCDHRHNKTWIAQNFPIFRFEPGFTEYDELWTGVTEEVQAAENYRSKEVLDEIFSSDANTYLSITSHSGEIGSILQVLGHRSFSLSTGQIIPVLVKAQTVPVGQATTTVTSAPWSSSSHCTVPPLSSLTASAPVLANGGCVCPSGAQPIDYTLPAFETTITASAAPSTSS